MRSLIVQSNSVDRSICGVRVESAGVDQRDLAPGGHASRSDVAPVFTAVSSYVNQAVIGARPNDVDVFIRRSHRVYNSATRLLRHFRCSIDPYAVRHLGLFARKIGADDVPAVAACGGLEQNVPREIENARVDG